MGVGEDQLGRIAKTAIDDASITFNPEEMTYEDALPARLLLEPLPTDPEGHTVPLDKMLRKYYKLRGYEPSGKPSRRTLSKFGIPFRAD